MGCPEVIEEWMNLYVDHALEDEEEKLLLQHIHSCQDCAEKFALLKELSARLERLPMATPSYDLVDAILPQLQMIDQARNEEASTVVPLVRKGRNTSKRSRFFRNGILGTAVAATIFGLFIYNHENNNMQDAGGQIEQQQVPVVDQSNNEKLNIQDLDDEHSVKGNQEDTGATSNKNQPADNKKLEDNQAKADDKTVVNNNQQDPKQVQPKKPVSSSVPKTDINPTEKVEKPTNDENSSPKNQDVARSTEDGEDQSNHGEGEEISKSNDQPIERFINGDMSIGMGMTSNVSQWISPDGLYSVELNDAHVYLYQISSESNKILLMDQALEGAWVDGAWSQDNLTFTYQTEVDGTIKSSLIDPKVVLEKNK
jgi:hypothetical protein